MQFPDDSNRHVIVGMTGSGKTFAGIHALSLRSYPIKPWLIYNFKDDQLINDIPHANHIDISEFPKGKKAKGIFVVHSAPGDFDAINDSLMKVWHRENTGVYVDEMYMLSKQYTFSTPFRYLLTQGRSRKTPVIALSQRPSWIDAFTFTEASFIQAFKLTTKRDWKAVAGFVAGGEDLNFGSLPKYHSFYYSSEAPEDDPHKLVTMRPSPDKQQILDTFDRRHPKRERKFFLW